MFAEVLIITGRRMALDYLLLPIRQLRAGVPGDIEAWASAPRNSGRAVDNDLFESENVYLKRYSY
jgi:hypothetical protein